MDGISLVSSIIAVIQLAGACLKLSKTWIGPSEFSSNDLTSLTTTLYEFMGAIKAFQTYLEIHEEEEARLSGLEYLKPALERCGKALEIIRGYMEGSSSIGRHFVGPRFDRKLKASLKALDSAKELFKMAWQADQQAILLGVERYIRNLSEDFRDVHDGVNTSLKRLRNDADTAYKEAKKAKEEQAEWQDATSRATSALRDAIDRQDARWYSEESRFILDWLTPINYALQQSDFIKRRQAGTGQWFLDSLEFKTWADSEKQTLFCPGIPGAGKTMLTSIVVDQLMSRFGNNDNIGIAYIYCDFQRQIEQNAENLLASLFKQLAQGRPSLPEGVRSLYDKHIAKRTLPSFGEISKALESVATQYSKVFIIVDALDECQASDGCRTNFLQEVFILQAKYKLNFLATSRPLPDIIESIESFNRSVSLEIRASAGDIQRYLDGHMSRLPSFVSRIPALQEDIKMWIIKAVDGMFLLAKLHLDSLIGKRSPKSLRAALAKLPTGSQAYDDAYNDAMRRVERQALDQEELAKQVLSWITCAKRPLATSELQHALAVEAGASELDESNLPAIEDMVSVCAGLVTVDDGDGFIRLVHYTAQEYLERTQGIWFPSAKKDIATTCLAYLSFDIFDTWFCNAAENIHTDENHDADGDSDAIKGYNSEEEIENLLHAYPFYSYASRNWAYHIHAAHLEKDEMVLSFLGTESKVSTSAEVGMKSLTRYTDDEEEEEYKPSRTTGLHVAAHFGLKETIISLMESEHDPNGRDSDGRTPLSYAAASGHDVVTKLLLSDIRVNVDAPDHEGRTPLSYAAGNGHDTIIKQLLQTGQVDPNSQDFAYADSALSWAAKNGHPAVVKLLLEEPTVDRNCRDYSGDTALVLAAEEEHHEVVRLFLAYVYGVDINIDDSFVELFSFVASEGGGDLIQQLLDNPRDLNARQGCINEIVDRADRMRLRLLRMPPPSPK